MNFQLYVVWYRGKLTKSNSVLYNTIRAESGTHCKAKDRWGKNGKSIVLNVPTGIRIRDSDTGKIIAEVDHHNQEIIIARGGIGGRGLRKSSFDFKATGSSENLVK